MNRLFLVSITFIIFFAACKDDEGSHMAYMEKIKDTVFKSYPTVAGVTVKVSDDGKEISIVLGDKHLYNASPETQQKEANDVAAMALNIFGKDNLLKKGTVIISKDEKNEQPAATDSKTIIINLDSLKPH